MNFFFLTESRFEFLGGTPLPEHPLRPPPPHPPARALTPSPGKRVNYNPLCPGWNTTQFYKAFIAASRIKDYSYTLPRFSAGLAVRQPGRRERPRAMFLPF